MLPAQVEVDEGGADTTAMVEAELHFRQALAGDVEQAVLDVVAGAQMSHADTGGGLADRIAVQHALCAQLMALAFAVHFEEKARRFPPGPVVALVVAIAERPPAVRQAVGQSLVGRMAMPIADGIATATQAELVGQAQWAVPVEPQPPLLLAGAPFTVVVAIEADPPGPERLALQAHAAATGLGTGQQLHLRRP